MHHCGSCMNSYRHRQSLSRHRQKCEGYKPSYNSNRQSFWNYEQKSFNPKMEVNDSDEDDMDGDVQVTDSYEPQETRIDQIGSYSLNPSTDTHYNDSGDDDSSMEDQSDHSDESSMEELDKDKISSYALSEPVTRRHCICLPLKVRAVIVGKSRSGKTTLLSYLLLAPDVLDYNMW